MKLLFVPHDIKQKHRPKHTVELCVTQEVANVVTYTPHKVLKQIRRDEMR